MGWSAYCRAVVEEACREFSRRIPIRVVLVAGLYFFSYDYSRLAREKRGPPVTRKAEDDVVPKMAMLQNPTQKSRNVVNEITSAPVNT